MLGGGEIGSVLLAVRAVAARFSRGSTAERMAGQMTTMSQWSSSLNSGGSWLGIEGHLPAAALDLDLALAPLRGSATRHLTLSWCHKKQD